MKLTFVVFVVATVVRSTLAIDFERHGPSVTRSGRQAASDDCSAHVPTEVIVHMLNKTCCKSGNTVNIFKDQQIYKDCVEEISKKNNVTIGDDLLETNKISCSKYHLIMKKFGCVEDCVAVKSKLFKEDGSADYEKIRKFVKEDVYTESWMKPFADRILDTSFKVINNTNFNQTTVVDALDMKCNLAPLILKQFLWIYKLANCPEAERRNDLSYCAKLQDGLAKMKASLAK